MVKSRSPPTPGLGLQSSPFGDTATSTTLYTPELTRHSAQTAVETSGVQGKNSVPGQVYFIGHTAYNGLEPMPHRQGVFVSELRSDDNNYISRHLAIRMVPDGNNQPIAAGTDHERELAKVEEHMKQYNCFNACVPVYNRGVHLRFDDLHDVGEGKAILEQHGFVCEYIDNYHFALAKSQDTATLDDHEGQISVVVRLSPSQHAATPFQILVENLTDLHSNVETALAFFGSVKCVVHVGYSHQLFELTFRVEFFSVEAANRAVANLTKKPHTGTDHTGLINYTFIKVSKWGGPRPASSPHRRLPRVDDQGRFTEYLHLPEVRIPTVQTRQNKVSREAILNGTDVRTTIMLRNIPNKLDWMTLKSLLDEVCFGTYDFLYLRIDFKSGHNVGYAFINFSDMDGMLAMLDKVEHRGWVGYRSSKNAELSYATIQGREALVQKFRNSSVMQQTPYCRPRLFRTWVESLRVYDHRLAGQEVEFPDPDNWSKFQRSIDSVKTVGLFPPTGGMSHPTIDRTHLSAYDRGTPRDMVHTANLFNFYGGATSFNAFAEAEKRIIARLFSDRYGPAPVGFVTFENIPTRLAQEMYDEYAQAQGVNIVRNPGVIGRPSGSQAVGQMPMFANNGQIQGGFAHGFSKAGPAYGPGSLFPRESQREAKNSEE